MNQHFQNPLCRLMRCYIIRENVFNSGWPLNKNHSSKPKLTSYHLVPEQHSTTTTIVSNLGEVTCFPCFWCMNLASTSCGEALVVLTPRFVTCWATLAFWFIDIPTLWPGCCCWSSWFALICCIRFCTGPIFCEPFCSVVVFVAKAWLAACVLLLKWYGTLYQYVHITSQYSSQVTQIITS